MAPVRVSKSQRAQGRVAARSDGSEVEEASQAGSQSSEDDSVTKLAKEMQREARTRREARRTAIIKSYRVAVKKIENDMTVKFEEITERLIKKHRLRLERLNDLIRRRSSIEAKMLASSQNIENAFIYADKALAFAYGRRLKSNGKHQKSPTA